VSFTPAAGIIYQVQNYYTDSNHNITRDIFMPRFMARLGVGYSGSRYYAGFASIGDYYTIPLAKNLTLNYTIGSITAYFGIRFEVPKAFQKASALLEKCDPANL